MFSIDHELHIPCCNTFCQSFQGIMNYSYPVLIHFVKVLNWSWTIYSLELDPLFWLSFSTHKSSFYKTFLDAANCFIIIIWGSFYQISSVYWLFKNPFFLKSCCTVKFLDNLFSIFLIIIRNVFCSVVYKPNSFFVYFQNKQIVLFSSFIFLNRVERAVHLKVTLSLVKYNVYNLQKNESEKFL